MDLDSWKPSDVYRRVSIALSVQLGIFVALALVMGFGWPWWLGWPLGVLLAAVLHWGAQRWYALRHRRSR
ncbi:hypothetical protein [Deinococcus peraridilitoris]|uniref:hypothetical protein n=1 Tax=Deinococcus peraridilitoris TaxID=432329 RepID=UPI00030BFDCF|nr:hypothetical protein [Deinococcus peraridilitoris]